MDNGLTNQIHPKKRNAIVTGLQIGQKKKIINQKPRLKNLVQMIIAHFDSPDHYGEYDAETGCGGYGKEFTVEECKRYVEESGGFKEFDYFC